MDEVVVADVATFVVVVVVAVFVGDMLGSVVVVVVDKYVDPQPVSDVVKLGLDPAVGVGHL